MNDRYSVDKNLPDNLLHSFYFWVDVNKMSCIFLQIQQITNGIIQGNFYFINLISTRYPNKNLATGKNSCSYRKNPVAIHFVDDLPHTNVECKTSRYETNKTPKVQYQGVAGKLCGNKEDYQEYDCQ